MYDVIDRYPRCRGMEIRTGTLLREMDERSATLSTGERIPTRMLCWTAGVKPAPVVAELGLPLDGHERIEVDATMRVCGRDNVWAIGDAAAVPDPARRRKTASPPTAQHAIRQGRRVTENVAATLRGGRPKPFRYRTLGVRLRGFPAWFAGRTSAELGQLGHPIALREAGEPVGER